MFSGIIQATGRLVQIQGQGIVLEFEHSQEHLAALQLKQDPFQLGESIAVNGVCLTVTQIQPQHEATRLSFDLAPETLSVTAMSEMQVGDLFNLERSLRMNERISGHLVSGHVDGVALIEGLKEIAGDCYELKVSLPEEFLRYCRLKGSIALQGISLTIHQILGNLLIFQIIPHTWKNTALRQLSQKDFALSHGKKVNFEVDLMAKYIINEVNHGTNK